MSASLKFDEDYIEHLALTGGERICVRLLRSSDKQGMLKAFSELSASSRQKRFFTAKRALSDEELRYFTETDGSDHFALTAVQIGDDGLEGDGLGVARCVRLADDPECAEVAITVIDRMQGKGIGRILLERLVDAAVERGIACFRFECLAYNIDIKKLVKNVCRVVETRYDGEIMVAEADLPRGAIDASQQTREAFFGLFGVLRALAVQSFEMHMELGRKTLDRTMKATLSGAGLLSPSRPLAKIKKKPTLPK